MCKNVNKFKNPLFSKSFLIIEIEISTITTNIKFFFKKIFHINILPCIFYLKICKKDNYKNI